MSWTAGEDRYMAAYRGEGPDDVPARCEDCGHRDHAGDVCREDQRDESAVICECERMRYERCGP